MPFIDDTGLVPIKVNCLYCGKEFFTWPSALWDRDKETGEPVYLCTQCIIIEKNIDEDAEFQACHEDDLEDCVWKEEE